MNGSFSEAADARDASSAVVEKHGDMTEHAEAHGHYDVVCKGPEPKDLQRYISLRDKITQIEAYNFVQRITTRALHAQLKREFDAIPLVEKWRERAENVVTTVGRNLALDTYLGGSAYTVVGPFLGLTQTTPTGNAADTMASHAGWVEAGNANAPTYTSPRKTVTAWNAASGASKTNSTALTFAITSSGTVGGCFLVYGTGAVSTIDNTSGVLYSAGAFTGGNKTVNNGDSLTVTYTATM